MLKVKAFPAEEGASGWHAILPRREPRPPLRGATRATWAVVGAGFSGVAAARRLAENRPGDRIVLVDAAEVGTGTSGRNTGIAFDVPYNSGAPLTELEGRRRHMRLNRAAIETLDTLIGAHGIACGWKRHGDKYHAAISDRGKVEAVEPVARELEVLGEPYRWVDRAELAARIGTRFYSGGLFTNGCAVVNPAALVRGLADTLPAQVELYERSRVVAVDYGSVVRLATDQGEIAADHLILANNGFAREFGFFRGRLLIFAIYASLTRRLSAAERASLGGDDEWAVSPANVFGGSAMRFSGDRFLLRQGIVHAPDMQRPRDLGAIAARHAERLHVRFPALAAVRPEHTWVGYDSMSENRAHGFGRLAANVYAAVCQNGVGIAKGTIAGILAADLATGRDNPLIADIQGLGAPNRLPPRPFLDLGVALRFAWDCWRNREEWR